MHTEEASVLPCLYWGDSSTPPPVGGSAQNDRPGFAKPSLCQLGERSRFQCQFVRIADMAFYLLTIR